MRILIILFTSFQPSACIASLLCQWSRRRLQVSHLCGRGRQREEQRVRHPPRSCFETLPRSTADTNAEISKFDPPPTPSKVEIPFFSVVIDVFFSVENLPWIMLLVMVMSTSAKHSSPQRRTLWGETPSATPATHICFENEVAFFGLL